MKNYININKTKISVTQGDIAKLKSGIIVEDIKEADEFKIRAAARSALERANSLKIDSIAFPALGCVSGGFPYLAAAKIMAQEIYRFLREDNTSLKEIIFCLYEKEAFDIFQKGVLKYLEHVTQVLEYGPFVTVDVIIETAGGIVLVERSNPPFGWALPGGFIDYNESLEQAARREAKEETGLILEDLRQFRAYSEPGRDPRFHTISTVFIAKSKGKPKAGDDAAFLKVFSPNEIQNLTLAFDHKQVLADYIKSL